MAIEIRTSEVPSIDGGRFVPGTRLSERYRIVALLGRGGMGEVYRAEDLKLEDAVALKFLPEKLEQNPEALARLEAEVKSARQITHPNICRVYDLAESDGLHFISMEYLPGDNLKTQLKRLGRPSLPKASELAVELCGALSAMHDCDLLHRDIKSSNLMLDGNGTLRLMDFGLAATVGCESSGGSWPYLAPELWSGAKPTVATDLYAVGLVLYELFTGHRAFRSKSVHELAWMHAETPPVPPCQLVASIDPSHEEMILRCLEKDPAKRPARAEEVAAAFTAVETSSVKLRSEQGRSERLSPTDFSVDMADIETASRGPLVKQIEETPVARALMITDLVDSTVITSELGDSKAVELWRRHDGLARDLLAKYSGREIDKSDGFLLLFERPWDAVRYALAYQRSLIDIRPEGCVLKARIGIHFGELYLSQTPAPHVARGAKPLEVEGAAKVIAARLMSLAEDGRIFLSRGAFDLSRQAASDFDQTVGRNDEKELRWLSHGAYLLQGFPEAIEVFEVALEGGSAIEPPADAPKVRRLVQQPTLAGWRPAVGVEIPARRHWRLQRKLGEGGFGEVWLAEREKTGERRVFKFCFDAVSLSSLQREITLFRLLKEELGDRSDITRILDWRLEEAPYFLESEYTNAGSLLEWAESQGGLAEVALETRLEIVAQISEALAAAHSVGVLHKDVKPANLLISEDVSGQIRAQLSDFGIGAVTELERLEQIGVTALGLTCRSEESSDSGTRLYMAPELLEGQHPRVQSDIYSLGVVLYQVVVGDLGRSLASGWTRDVADDCLIADIAMAVEGRPERRLADARQLADRLRALDERRDEVEAQRLKEEEAERLAVALGKARQRRKLWLQISAILALVAISNGFLAYRVRQEADRASLEAERAQEEVEQTSQVVGFLEDLFEIADPYRIDFPSGRELTVADILARGAERLREFENFPKSQARLMHSLGKVHLQLEEFDRAETLLKESLALRQDKLASNHRDIAEGLHTLGKLHETKEDYDAAEPLYRDALKIWRRLGGNEHPDLASTLNDLAIVVRRKGDYEAAELLAWQALEMRRRLFNNEHLDVVSSLNNLANLFSRKGDYEAARSKHLEALGMLRRLVGEEHPDVASALNDLGSVFQAEGNYIKAEAMYQEALEMRQHLFGNEHRLVAYSLHNLALILTEKEDYESAEKLARDSLEMLSRLLGRESLGVGNGLDTLAGILQGRGRYDEAESLLREALEINRAFLGDEHPKTAFILSNLANVLKEKGLYGSAETMHRQALEMRLHLLGEEHPEVASSLHDLASLLLMKGDSAGAGPLLERALDMRRRLLGDRHPEVADSLEILMRLYDELGLPEKSRTYRTLRSQVASGRA